MVVTCEYCKTELTTKKVLKQHQLNSRYCLMSRGIRETQHKCHICGAFFTTKQFLVQHEIMCLKKTQSISGNILNDKKALEERVKELEIRNAELEERILELEEINNESIVSSVDIQTDVFQLNPNYEVAKMVFDLVFPEIDIETIKQDSVYNSELLNEKIKNEDFFETT